MSIKVIAQLNPFNSEITEFEAKNGESIFEIIRKIDPHKAVNTGWRVLISDRIVTDFSEIPEKNQTVYIKLVPEGDNKDVGIGMKIGGGLLTAVGVLVSIWCQPLGLALVGAGVGLFSGGMVLYNTNIPTVDSKSPEQDPSVRGGRNQKREKGYIPLLLGRRRIYPDLVSSFTWVDPESQCQYLYQLLCCGQKDQKIENDTIKQDETLLADLSGGSISSILSGNDSLVQMQITQGADVPPLVTKSVHEDQINTKLVKKDSEGVLGDIIRTTPDGTEEINVDIFFYSGLGKYNDDGDIESTSVQVEAYYKQKDQDDSAYKLLGYFDPNAEETETKTFSQVFKYKDSYSSGFTPESAWRYFEYWERIGGDNFTVKLSEKSKYTFSDVSRLDVPTSGVGSAIFQFTISFSVTYTNHAGTNNLSGSELKTKRYAITQSGLAASSYTVKIVRVTDDSEDSKVVDEVYVGSVRSVCNTQPVSKAKCQKLTLVGLKIKASDKFNGTVDQLNFISQSKAPIYDGTENGADSWTQSALTSNPASMAILAMQGEMAQQKLSSSDIDWNAFGKLYEWCDKNGYECNEYISDSITIQELLTNIGLICRSEITRINGKITVIQDVERDSFVQMFSPRNSYDYSEQIAFSDIPDRLAVSFVNADAGFAEDECYVYNTDDGNVSSAGYETSQDLNLWGVTNSKQARKLGMYNFAVTKARPLIHKFSTDIEYMLCRKGDWIKYAGDIALAGLKQGRLTGLVYSGGKIAGVQTDEELTMEADKSYALRIRKSDGTAELLSLITKKGTFTEVSFENNVEASLGISEGDLFYFGTIGNDSVDLIVTDITCSENLTAELTCVEYAPDIFHVDSDDFLLPEFQSQISGELGAVDSGSYGELTDKAFTVVEYALSSSQKTEPDASATWSTTQPERTLGTYVWMRIKTFYFNGNKDVANPVCISGQDAYSIYITSTAGGYFKNSTGTTTLTAIILQGNQELDSDGTKYSYTWTKYLQNGKQDTTFIKVGKSITVNASDINEMATFEVEVSDE